MAAAAHYRIEHVSRYRYSCPARRCVMALCLKPRTDRGQRLHRFEVETRPVAALMEERDCFGNARHVFNVHREHDGLEIAARSHVEAAPAVALPERLEPNAWQELRAHAGSFAHWDFTRPSALARPSAALAAFVERRRIEPGDDPLHGLLRLVEALHDAFRYVPGSTTAHSPIEHVLATGRGVCQDYTHVMIAIARGWGVPARYVSGYLHVLGLSGEQAAANATHAWVECLLPDLGWVGFDPTNRSLADERHVRVAHGRDYRDVSPTRGVFQGGGETRLEVEVEVRAHRDRDEKGARRP